jgi:hypothetical protein
MPIDWDGKVENPKLLCARTGEVLPPGATFWSALAFVGDAFVRQDFSEAVWDEVDREGYISWWRQRVPTPDGPQVKPIDIEALLGIFHALKDETVRAKQCFCYVVLLFLVRARKLRFKDVLIENGQSILLVEDKQLRCVYRIRDPQLSAEEEAQVQANLQEIMDGPVVEAEPAGGSEQVDTGKAGTPVHVTPITDAPNTETSNVENPTADKTAHANDE